jgi:hypothetical protein
MHYQYFLIFGLSFLKKKEKGLSDNSGPNSQPLGLWALASHWWLTPVIPPTQEAEIRRIVVRSQPRQIIP